MQQEQEEKEDGEEEDDEVGGSWQCGGGRDYQRLLGATKDN